MEREEGLMLLFYTTHITKRLQYIVDTLFKGEATITHHRETLQQYTGAKINYSPERISEKEVWVQPYGLLEEQAIHQQEIHCFEWNNLKVFFKTGGDLPFDIFAASFYLLSRYEEYLPHEKDQYGRYLHTNSIAYKEGFLDTPLVNQWMLAFNRQLQQHADWHPKESSFTFCPTYDIDIAYSYRHQPVIKNIAAFYRDLLQGKFEQVVERANVYSGKKPDPFDVYDWLHLLHRQHQLAPVYFFLLADKRGAYDKNIPPRNTAMKQLVQQHARQYQTGIHPSWQSGDSEVVLGKEINSLKNILGTAVQHSRQHYIRMQLPDTYNRLLQQGITEEYSMGYGTVNGFRASYAQPYYWYNLLKEETTQLCIHPFCYMDATCIFSQRYTTEQASMELQHYYNAVQSVNGELITIFHNHFLTEQPEWLPWRDVYTAFLQKNFAATND